MTNQGHTKTDPVAQGDTRRKAERDLVALGIAFGAICLFVATGGSALPGVIRSLTSGGPGPSHLLVNALLLNIALVIFSWRRYRQMREEISIREEAEREARLLSEIDPLTGCLNRRAMSVYSEALRSDANQQGRAVAYLMLDADNFKQINDMYGHAAGDDALVEFAERIRKIMPKDALLARLGGDEFAVAMPYAPAQPERVEDLVIRIYEKMALPITTEKATVEMAVSMGLATDYGDQGFNPLIKDTSALMKHADIAMYQAKKQGKNRFCWFEENMESELRRRNELETGIRSGLVDGEFEPFYEQQIDIETGEIIGFEMLARWRSSKMGLVSPEIFIPIAEEIGLISELSERLMQRAFFDASEWDPGISLSINISPIQLRDPWFAQKLLKRLVETNFPPNRLEIEITESCLHENLGMVRTMITSLQNQGVRVSLDDFGTGYSSLEQLRSLPFNRLKIDRTFISELSEKDGKSRIVDAIVSLGRGLDMPIIAEGIENEDILKALRQIGNLKGQGYLYGKPETASDVRERLGKKGLLNLSATAKDEARGDHPSSREKAATAADRNDPESILRRARG